MRATLAAVVVAATALFQVATAAFAQEEPLPVTPGAGKYLPAAADLGDGWVGLWQAGIDPGAELFKEGVKGVYGGPAGARAIVYAWVIQDSVTAVRRSWDETSDAFDSARYEFASDYDYSLIEELEALDPPAGCVEALRAEGVDDVQEVPAGITLCAVDPDVIILTIVSGTLNDTVGYAASDALTGIALAAAGA